QKNKLFAYHPESREGLLYKFDFCYNANTKQEEIFGDVVVPAVHALLRGYNTSIISYGPTQTGKTGLFYGTEEEPGLINMALEEIFSTLTNLVHLRYTISVSYWE